MHLSAQKPNEGPPREVENEEVKEVEIINSDILHFEQHEERKLTKLIGNVVLKQDQVLMYCDSALLDKDENKLEAWGHVHIRNDTVNAYSDYLNYDSKAKLILLKHHAWLTDSKARIVSDENILPDAAEGSLLPYRWQSIPREICHHQSVRPLLHQKF
jgi:lipopolysaccharide assembly outer membrane protein LptD (OstA)